VMPNRRFPARPIEERADCSIVHDATMTRLACAGIMAHRGLTRVGVPIISRTTPARRPLLVAPILFRLALHRRRCRAFNTS
jgi:hypothetical protein